MIVVHWKKIKTPTFGVLGPTSWHDPLRLLNSRVLALASFETTKLPTVQASGRERERYMRIKH